ncbi:MAG: Wzz/FepE/Etk N-terminal domain-containing protein [Ignavibacteriaceae bacterium]|nr:Wzz/FepE/Etk N-terminal domain-containing protein [Ignavibacteriaceae bacterium]
MQEIVNSENKTKNIKNFEDFLIILFKYGRLIFWNTLVITIFAIIISLLMDKWFTSTASIIPPKKKGGIFGDIGSFSSTIKDLSKTLGKLGAASDETYDYLVILQSRNAAEKVIKKFNLREVYKIDKDKPFEDVISELGNNVKFNIEDEGNITISVTDKNPNRAAEMANYYVQILNEISVSLGTTEAKSNREFVEKRYEQVKTDLVKAEENMKEFSKKYNIYSIDEQTKAAIGAAAELKAQIALSEIELGVMLRSLGSNNPLIPGVKLKIEEMNKKLKSMKFGENNNSTDQQLNLFVPFTNLPEVGLQYIRYMREFEIQNKLLEFILPLYEQAKIEEQKNLPVALVLDKAVPAQKKSSPKRAIIVLASMLLSFFISVIFALIINSLNEIKENKERYSKINNGIFQPLRGIFFLRR